jgi:CO/xanthine dehydrogenase Mo-binding subunit
MTLEQHPAAAKIATETALKAAGARRWIGKSLNRVEDPRFLRGEGRYIDDIKLQNMAHAAIVRSPHAHARIVSIDA